MTDTPKKFLDIEIARAMFEQSDNAFKAGDYQHSIIWNRAAILAMDIAKNWGKHHD